VNDNGLIEFQRESQGGLTIVDHLTYNDEAYEACRNVFGLGIEIS